MTKNRRKALIRELNSLTSVIIRKQSRYCELCNEYVWYHMMARHHIFGRGGNMIFKLEGMSGVCPGCHEEARQHKQRILDRYITLRGRKWYIEMITEKAKTKKWTVGELEALEVELNENPV